MAAAGAVNARVDFYNFLGATHVVVDWFGVFTERVRRRRPRKWCVGERGDRDVDLTSGGPNCPDSADALRRLRVVMMVGLF